MNNDQVLSCLVLGQHLADLQYHCFIAVSINVTFTIERSSAIQLIEIIVMIVIVIHDEECGTALLEKFVLMASRPAPTEPRR